MVAKKFYPLHLFFYIFGDYFYAYFQISYKLILVLIEIFQYQNKN